MSCGCEHCHCNISYEDYLNSLSINELQEELSIKNNSLYELKSTVSTLSRQNIDNTSETNKLNEIKEDIKIINTVLSNKKDNKDVL